MFCTMPSSTASQPQFAFTTEGTQSTFTRIPMGYLSILAIAHNLHRQDLNCIHLSPDMTLHQ